MLAWALRCKALPHLRPMICNSLICTLYIVVGTVVFKYSDSHAIPSCAPGECKSWTFVEALYFTMATISTVGYGDFSPNKELGWLLFFTIMYIIVGIVAIFPRLASIVHEASHPVFEGARQFLDKLFPRHPVDLDGDGSHDFYMPNHPFIYYSKALACPLLLFTAVQLLFAGLFCLVESWDYGIAVYHCLVTATTVGYGDVSITEQQGYILATIHMIISVSMLAAIIGDIEDLREKRRAEETRARIVLGTLNVDHIMSLDKDGGGIDRFEFVIGMLIRLEVVATEDVDTFLAHFSMLDESGDGTISKEELQRYAALQTAKAERVGIVQHQLLQETAKRSRMWDNFASV
ncbi:hypothetical protein AB1Y20_014520 [Prymnesium parvum]|uniref:EF-hand domain-containing protein n=1 Tax=Prymnesium parvum TaxID=97485 RepID=A0AB34IDL2_PRYPA